METVATQHAEYNLDAMRGSAYKASSLLKAMGNADRLMLLCQLSQGELSVGELEAELGILQPTLSQQLSVLREEGLVETRREGKRIFYGVRSRQALAVLKVLHDQYCNPKAGK